MNSAPSPARLCILIVTLSTLGVLAQRRSIADQSPPPVSFTLPLALASTIEGAIALPGQQDRFSLELQAGQRLIFDGLGQPQALLRARLESPSARQLWEIYAHDDSPPVYITEPGIHTLVLFGWNGATADYRFRMLDLRQSESIEVDDIVSGQLADPTQIQAYQFTGSAGQRFRFESVAANPSSATWSLLAPFDQVLGGADITSDLGEVTLPVSGPYWVLVQGRPDTTGPLDFQIRAALVSNPSGSPSGFNVIHSATLQPGETNLYHYSAPAGTAVYFDALGGNASWLWTELRTPDGEIILSTWGLSDFGPVTLPLSGSYTLEIRATDAYSPSSYSVRLLDLSSTAVALDPGTDASGAIDPPLTTEVFRFEGTPGQRLYLDLIETPPGEVYFQLVSPSGRVVDAPWWWSNDDAGLFNLTEPGTHHLLVHGRSDSIVHYRFRLLDLALEPTVALPFDTPVNGRLELARESQLYRFFGVAGQRLFFDAQFSTGPAAWTVFTPNNQSLGLPEFGSDFALTLPETGSYGLVVASEVNTALAYRFEVITPTTITAPLPLGEEIEASLTTRGAQLRFTFNGSVGQRLYLDQLGSDPIDFDTRLLGPDGTAIFQINGVHADFGPVTLPVAGPYTMVIGGNTTDTGGCRFRLLDLAAPPVLPLALNQTVSDELEPARETHLYLIPGNLGERLALDSLAPSSSAFWSFYAPDNHLFASASLGEDFVVSLPQSGAHLLAVSTLSTAPTPYAFNVRTTTTTTASLPLDAVIQGTVDNPGTEHRYAFDGTVGMQLYYDAQNQNADSLDLQILDPLDHAVLQHYTDADFGPFRLTGSGTYTVVIGGLSPRTGAYRFRLLDLAHTAEMSVELSGELDPHHETDVVRFEALAGQRVLLEPLSTSGPSASWRLLAPSGALLAQDNITNPLPEVFLRENGTHHLLIEGYTDGATTLQYHVRRTTTQPTGTPSGFGTLHSGAITLAETRLFTYTAPAGLLVYFDSQTPTDTRLEMYLYSDSGSLLLQSSLGYDQGPFPLPASGDYTLAIRGQDPAATGDYRFRLLDLAANSTPLTLGTVVDVHLTEPYETRFFQFNGIPGQHLYYDALTAGWLPDFYLRGLDPAGGFLLFGSGSPLADTGPSPVSLPGTHHLMLVSQQADPVTLAFRLLDLAETPALPLELGEPKSATLDPGPQTHIYRVPLAGPSQIFFRGSSFDWNVTWTLCAPNFDWVAGGYLAGDVEISLPDQTGDYLLFVAGSQPEPFPYTIALHASTSTSSQLSFNAPMAGNLAGAGSEHRFTFTASTGQTVYYDALQADFDTVYVSLISPTGRLLSQGNSDSDQGPILLTETGTYTLVQDNWLFDETDFQFRLLDGANQPGLALDALVQQTLDPGLAAHLYQLQPTPGLRLFFDGSHTNSEAAWWSFLTPTGDYLSGNNFRGDLEAIPNLPGTHWLVISSQDPSPAPYSFRVIPGNHAPTLGDLEDRTVDEEVTLEFDALATDLESPNDILSFSLDPDAPDGATIDPLTGRFRWTPAEHHGPGEYPITVRVSDDGIPSLGDSRAMVIRVREINQSPTLNSVSDHTIHAGAAVRLPILATDPDLPSNTLVYSLLEAPPGATLDPATGWFDWTSAVVDAGTTLPITVKLSDDGLPPLSDTAAFVIAVADPLRLESIDFKDGQVTLHWQGIASHNYRVQYRDELGAQTWVDLPGDILSPGALTSKTDSTLDPGRDRYYRILDVP